MPSITQRKRIYVTSFLKLFPKKIRAVTQGPRYGVLVRGGVNEFD